MTRSTQPAHLPANHFTPRTGRGIAYDTPDEMAAWLLEHPQEAGAYMESQYDLAAMMGNEGDFRAMRECLNFLVDVFVALAKLKGEKHLE